MKRIIAVVMILISVLCITVPLTASAEEEFIGTYEAFDTIEVKWSMEPGMNNYSDIKYSVCLLEDNKYVEKNGLGILKKMESNRISNPTEIYTEFLIEKAGDVYLVMKVNGSVYDVRYVKVTSASTSKKIKKYVGAFLTSLPKLTFGRYIFIDNQDAENFPVLFTPGISRNFIVNENGGQTHFTTKIILVFAIVVIITLIIGIKMFVIADNEIMVPELLLMLAFWFSVITVLAFIQDLFLNQYDIIGFGHYAKISVIVGYSIFAALFLILILKLWDEKSAVLLIMSAFSMYLIYHIFVFMLMAIFAIVGGVLVTVFVLKIMASAPTPSSNDTGNDSNNERRSFTYDVYVHDSRMTYTDMITLEKYVVLSDGKTVISSDGTPYVLHYENGSYYIEDLYGARTYLRKDI